MHTDGKKGDGSSTAHEIGGHRSPSGLGGPPPRHISTMVWLVAPRQNDAAQLTQAPLGHDLEQALVAALAPRIERDAVQPLPNFTQLERRRPV